MGALGEQSAAGGRGMVVGVEMGGHPLRGEWAKLEPLFAKARAAGLKVSLHFAENRGWEEEQNAILDFAPERVGHAVYMSDAIRDRLLASRIPVEVCVTCHESYYKVAAANNVFGMLRSREHPAVLCCDNAGLLNTSLSNELYLVATTFKLTPRDLAVLLRDGISAAFLEASQKERLVSESEARLMQLLPVLSPDFVPTATARSGSAASGWAFWGPALVIAVGAAGVAVITVAKRR
ncbi:hypothetical protein T484DRAFT_2794993 [Baffinella frigidus]|nr:hypothetical protein T484DRAFT_2794993 [Cryptophyta sp. CCMP2293]